MATLQDIIKQKSSRLQSVPDDLFSGIDNFQSFIFEEVLALLSEMDSSGGYFLKSRKNQNLAIAIKEELKKVLNGKEYLSSVMQFASEFDQQKKITDDYFKKIFDDFKPSKLNNFIVEKSKNDAIELLTSATPKTGFLQDLTGQIDDAISSQASWRDTVKALRIQALGIPDAGINDRYISSDAKDGKLLRYVKQIASDSLALSDRAYTHAIASDLGSEWFLYFGDELPTSREFCIERHGKYFHKKEIEEWASLDWAGKMKDSTNKQTIFINCGGWNCKHSLLPITVDQVPRDVLIRNIESGNYEPTEFDKKELKL